MHSILIINKEDLKIRPEELSVETDSHDEVYMDTGKDLSILKSRYRNGGYIEYSELYKESVKANPNSLNSVMQAELFTDDIPKGVRTSKLSDKPNLIEIVINETSSIFLNKEDLKDCKSYKVKFNFYIDGLYVKSELEDQLHRYFPNLRFELHVHSESMINKFPIINKMFKSNELSMFDYKPNLYTIFDATSKCATISQMGVEALTRYETYLNSGEGKFKERYYIFNLKDTWKVIIIPRNKFKSAKVNLKLFGDLEDLTKVFSLETIVEQLKLSMWKIVPDIKDKVVNILIEQENY